MLKKLLPQIRYNFHRGSQIFVESVASFRSSECIQRAAALTYYTIFSIVPIFALFFGVAKGFGLDEWFKEEMLRRYSSQSEVLNNIYNFAYTALHEARGGLVAGIGALLLCWTLIKMVGHIEMAFNRVWAAPRSRSIFRKFTDYLPVIIILPVFYVAAGSASFMVADKVSTWAEAYSFAKVSTPLIGFAMECSPFVLNWILFSFLYLFLPNTRVRWGAAIFGGVIAGSLEQLMQNCYIYVQMALSSYNVIYGSFSVLPLFLISTNLSWLILLYGVNLSHLWQTFDYESKINKDASLGRAERRLLALLLAAETARSFEAGEPPPDMLKLAQRSRMSRTLATELLRKLVQRHVLIPVKNGEYEESGYIPALPLEKMTIAEVQRRLDDLRGVHITGAMESELTGKLEGLIKTLADRLTNAPENIPVTRLFHK